MGCTNSLHQTRKLVNSDFQSRPNASPKVHFLCFFLVFRRLRLYLCTTKTRQRDYYKDIENKLQFPTSRGRNQLQRGAKRLYVQLKLNNMTKQKTMIDELKYRIARYRSMGNGVMCQSLYNQLRALKAQQ
jgi:hypothetical protein